MVKSPSKTEKKIKDTNMNVKFPHEVYMELQEIADNLGGMTLSSMIRMLVYAQLDKVHKTGDPKAFLDLTKKNK